MDFVIVILLFPSDPHPDATTMNYAILVVGGWIFLCLVYYYIPVYGGVHWFLGPVANVLEGDKASDMEDLNARVSVSVEDARNS